MGNFLCKCLAGAPRSLLPDSDGDEVAYNERFLEDVVLGEGEFGLVKLVHDMKGGGGSTNTNTNNNRDLQQQHQPMACKLLKKGVVFRDNVLYSPLKPEVLRGEIEMLRTLAGQCYCLRLIAVYESPRCLYVVTEYCAGGLLTEYVARQTQAADSFTVTDVSRMAYQMISALNHCAHHRILHRDIKPENIMCIDPAPGADIRIIDFGSGCIDREITTTNTGSSSNGAQQTNNGTQSEESQKLLTVNGLRVHSTFAGSAFYTSPEMYQRHYTACTDVWSLGVTLYVLVAGYPADALQRAFNVLQCVNRNLKTDLPNLLDPSLPQSLYDLLEHCLVYHYSDRPSVSSLLKHEFLQLHKEEDQQSITGAAAGPELLSLEQVSAAAAATTSTDFLLDGSSSGRRKNNVALLGSVHRHNLFLEFKKYERSLTALLATMLTKVELDHLLRMLQERVATLSASAIANDTIHIGTPNGKGGNNNEEMESLHATHLSKPSGIETSSPQRRARLHQTTTLAVIPVSELKTILRNDLMNEVAYVLRIIKKDILFWTLGLLSSLSSTSPLTDLKQCPSCLVQSCTIASRTTQHC